MKTTHSFYDFKKDLPVAKITEKQVAELLAEKYNMKIFRFGDTNAWDIAMEKNDKIYTFEVKEDFSHARTGNIGLEFESWGRLSGISVSQAMYYIYKVHNSDGTFNIWKIKTSTLKDMIKNKLYSRIISGGDKGSNSKNYLFKDTVFYKYAEMIA